MAEEPNMMYFDLKKQERDAAIGYLLGNILNARQACGIPSNEKKFDEDVNIYLAHLLFAFLLPDYQKLISRYLSLNASDLMEAVEKQNDKVVRYFIYKVNADYLLIHLGVFNDLASGRRSFQKSERQFIELGESYYDHASQFNYQIYRKHTAVGDVLEKLSHSFGDYTRILHVLREEFFELVKRMKLENDHVDKKDMSMAKLINGLEFEQKVNEFLDLYGAWLQVKSQDMKLKVIRAAEAIKAIDSSFQFNPELLEQKREGRLS